MGRPIEREASILSTLSELGYNYNSLAELRQSGTRYTKAIPALIGELSADNDPRLLEEVVRALSVPWAAPYAVEPLIRLFRAISNAVDPSGLGVRWTIGNALYALYSDEYFPEFAELVTERKFGRARQMVVLGLGKSKNPDAVQVLLGLVDEPGIDGHAVQALARFRSPLARLAFESKLSDKRSWVRRQARKGLKKIS